MENTCLLLACLPESGASWLFVGADTLTGLGAALLRHWALFSGALLLLLGGLLFLRRTTQKFGEELQDALNQQEALVDAPAAATASNAPADPSLTRQLIALLATRPARGPAADSLVALGETVLPALKDALALETDERRLHHLSQVVARLGTPAARQHLMGLAKSGGLHGRAAALQALSCFASVQSDAPLFQRLVEEEMRLAQQLLHGMIEANDVLRAALRYELHQGAQRLFGLLGQLYERQPLLDVQRSILHLAGKRQDRYLQALESLLPRPIYRGLQALLLDDELRSQARTFDELLGPAVPSEPIQTMIVRRGAAAFSAWTISVALRQWHPQPATVAYLYPHVQAGSQLVQESAWEVLRHLPVQRPAAYDWLLAEYPALAQQAATVPAACISARERVLMLKATPLFTETPENVLGDIVPIMKEVAFQPGQQIFDKGTLGTSLFIVCEGEVDILNETRHLTTFQKGDFFGELALLDVAPRSATAIAHGRVVAFRLDQEDFYDLMLERREVLHNILRALCQRLRQQNEKTRALH